MDLDAKTAPEDHAPYSFFRSRKFGVLSVWALMLLAAFGTYVLTRDLEDRGGNAASVFLSADGVHEVYLFRDRAEPVALVVQRGEEVVFVVQDEGFHNMAQERESRGDARLESGEFGMGESYSLVFSNRGEYSFYDRLNQDIRVTITVR
ncbi:MAG: hypothetical protein HZA81_01000 [Candidatus Taylorbacteria bacterium]|nr:hypothetical protein [Candidatus Taylorbacteria bacterium]